jgi:excisionase family DNA binding protein
MSAHTTIWLTAREAAVYVRVDVVTLRRAVKAGRLQSFRLNCGRHIRFRVEDLDRWLAATPVTTEAAS